MSGARRPTLSGQSVDVAALQARWDCESRLDSSKDLVTNFVDELQAYSGLPRAEAEQLFFNGTEEYAREWLEKYQHDPTARTKFYDEAFTHIFFVMHNSALRTRLSSPLLYVYASDLAKRHGARHYLDYGAGTGSGAMFFAKAGIDTTLADISSRMLDFAKWRFERRGLRAIYVDVKQQPMPTETFDMITCFHVLQHVEDPLGLLRTLRSALKPGGVLFVNGSLKKDPARPMQPDHGGVKMRRRYRSLGFQTLWEPTHVMHQLSRTSPVAFQKVHRPALVNAAYGVFDTVVTSPALRRGVYLATAPLRGGRQ